MRRERKEWKGNISIAVYVMVMAGLVAQRLRMLSNSS
jgi:hypothetical protein